MLEVFLLSVSLVAAQLGRLLFYIPSFVWYFLHPCLRDRMYTHLNPWLIVVCVLRIIVCFVFNSIEYVVQVEPKVLAAVGHDCFSSRWSHYRLCPFDYGVHHTCLFALRRC